jgi:molybdenum cofactor cytidylyltransferase
MNLSCKVTGIILAAGTSTRMGRTKQLLPFRGQTILECVVDNALASDLHQVVVVLGHDSEALERLLTNRDITVIHNHHYEKGQSSSLKVGLRILTEEVDAALFLLGDQPLITPEIINLLLAAYKSSPCPIVLPVFKGRRGNPALFSRETFPRLATLKENCGARTLFEEYAERILKVPVSDPAIHFDIDTEENYRQLLLLERQ